MNDPKIAEAIKVMFGLPDNMDFSKMGGAGGAGGAGGEGGDGAADEEFDPKDMENENLFGKANE